MMCCYLNVHFQGQRVNCDILLFLLNHSEGVTNKVGITVWYTEYTYTAYRVIQEKTDRYFERVFKIYFYFVQ